MATLTRSPLISNGKVQPPFNTPFVIGNIALALLSSPLPLVAQSELQAPQRLNINANTSQGSFALINAPVVSAPFVNKQNNALDKARINSDTSQGAFALIRTPVIVGTPFVNLPTITPERKKDVFDYSRGIPKPLYSDSTFSFKNYFQAAPDLKRSVVDTSQSAFLTLQPVIIPVKPFFNPPITLLDKFHITPQDTTQQTNLVLGVPSCVEVTLSVVQPYVTVYFWKRTA